ncbi:hypothetical protein SAMN05216469_13011 [Ruminococcus albus]|uniref:Uncharacterized protein n=1 Tax=Ruminococcus albus TaxID=1264 RepID=A0A1H7Q713_RUMAL|nr:hypothetical protein SAMN05216469_13011 [Ruminococcus albus]
MISCETDLTSHPAVRSVLYDKNIILQINTVIYENHSTKDPDKISERIPCGIAIVICHKGRVFKFQSSYDRSTEY